jgi:hypothetical protein
MFLCNLIIIVHLRQLFQRIVVNGLLQLQHIDTTDSV